MPWGRLWSYEKQQGCYWDYATVIDAYGSGKTWVPVARPAQCSCRWPFNDPSEIAACPVCMSENTLKVKAVPHAGMTWANFVVGADVEVHGEYDVTWTSIKEVASAGVLGS